jgi:hypothetical protein
MPFKYRDKRNKYFKEYMRKWRAEKRRENLETESIPSSSGSETRQEEGQKNSAESKFYEILAA